MEYQCFRGTGAVPVRVIHIKGDLDASSYLELVKTAQKLYDAGAQNLLLEPNRPGVHQQRRAGFPAHRHQDVPRRKIRFGWTGWGAYKEIDRDRESGVLSHVKLLNPLNYKSNDSKKIPALPTHPFSLFAHRFRLAQI